MKGMVKRETLKRRKEECDIGQHAFFDTRGGDQICEVCGLRSEKRPEAEPEPVVEMKTQDSQREWYAEFDRHLTGCAGSKLPFTSNHVMAIVGPPPGDDVRVNNIMAGAAERGIIKATGNTVGQLAEWIGV